MRSIYNENERDIMRAHAQESSNTEMDWNLSKDSIETNNQCLYKYVIKYLN